MSQATLGETPYLNSSLFSGYYLDERVGDLEEWDCDEEAEEAFETLRELWEAEGDLLPSYKEDELLGAWIDEVLDMLGFDTLQETTLPSGGGYNDRLLFDSADARREAARQKRDGNIEGMYGRSAAILEAKQYGADFTQRFSEQRSYRDASHQIKYYLEHTPERVDWGILTDGKKWRLYGTKDYATETFYEVDLPELLEYGDLEGFKYFMRSSALRHSVRSPGRRSSIRSGTSPRLPRRNSAKTCRTTFSRRCGCLAKASSTRTAWTSTPTKRSRSSRRLSRSEVL